MRNPADRLVCGACGAVTEVEYIPNAADRLAECRRVMEQALEALQEFPTHGEYFMEHMDATDMAQVAIKALKEALK